MHVLTKIFIVLVSLLAVLLVPLVVVYAHNEDSYKNRFQDAELKAAASEQALKAAEARLGAELTKKDLTISDLDAVSRKLQNDKAATDATVRQLESQLSAANGERAEFGAQLQTIAESVKAGQTLTETLVSELRSLRTTAVAIEREKVQLDEALRDVTSQLEVAEQARRALAEELARLKDEHTKTLTQLGIAIGQGFVTGGRTAALGIIPDKTLTANVIRVERSTGQVLAEIDAGSTSGVKKDWNMTIANGGNFVANLRIVDVDINRATGVVTLEDPKSRGNVQVGNTAHALAGQQ